MKKRIPKSVMLISASFLSIVLRFSTYAVEFTPDETDCVNVPQELDECPYIFYENDKIVIKWIEAGNVIEKVYSSEDFSELNISSCEAFEAKYLNFNKELVVDNQQEFSGVSKIAILSDIHGQYDLLIRLLKAHKVIDEKRNWIFGDEHFVITGDVFDRGGKVTETLWFLYKLEQQAELAGGKVHLLLGNHEVMVLGGDLRYVSDKYKMVSAKLNASYDELFSANTLLGQWLRTKPVAISVNNIAFAHAGFSPEFVDMNFDIETVNQLFHEEILDKPKKSVNKSDTLRFMVKSDGPIWYRGYFKDESFTKQKAQEITDFMGVSAVVVGHTSYKEVRQHFDGLIYSVDSSIKNGKYGEILMWEAGEFFRGTLTGELQKF